MANRERTWLGLGLLAAAPWLIGASLEASSIEDRRTVITVTGRAEQTRQPQFVIVSAAVESDSDSASGAMRNNANAMARLRSVLARSGIRPGDIRTSDLTLSPRRSSDQSDQIVGFRASHRLSVTFRHIDQSGTILDALVGVGATNIQGPRISWWSRTQGADPAARNAAIADANGQAEAYARSLGLRVRRVLKMSDGGSHSTPPAAMHRAADTQIIPGEEVILTTVHAEYELVS